MNDIASQPASPSGSSARPGASSEAERFWLAVQDLVRRRLHDVDGLLTHGLGPIAADMLESVDASIPPDLGRQQRLVRVAALTAPHLLARVREACDGPLLLLKGPEVAARYPRHARAYGDLDIVAPDAQAAQRALLAAGFVEVEDPDRRWVGIQHLNPLVRHGVPLAVEIHSVPKWPDGLEAPRPDELFERAVPSVLGVPGVMGPAAGDHALLLAAHAWAHQPLGRVRDLVDVGAMRAGADPAELGRRARAWEMLPLWRTTTDALDAILENRRTWPVRLWATHLPRLREQTVLEAHMERLLSPFWGLSASSALPRAAEALVDEFRPAFDEGWSDKLERTASALRRPFAPLTKHRRMLGDSATRGQRRNEPPERRP